MKNNKGHVRLQQEVDLATNNISPLELVRQLSSSLPPQLTSHQNVYTFLDETTRYWGTPGHTDESIQQHLVNTIQKYGMQFASWDVFQLYVALVLMQKSNLKEMNWLAIMFPQSFGFHDIEQAHANNTNDILLNKALFSLLEEFILNQGQRISKIGKERIEHPNPYLNLYYAISCLWLVCIIIGIALGCYYVEKQYATNVENCDNLWQVFANLRSSVQELCTEYGGELCAKPLPIAPVPGNGKRDDCLPVDCERFHEIDENSCCDSKPACGQELVPYSYNVTTACSEFLACSGKPWYVGSLFGIIGGGFALAIISLLILHKIRIPDTTTKNIDPGLAISSIFSKNFPEANQWYQENLNSSQIKNLQILFICIVLSRLHKSVTGAFLHSLPNHNRPPDQPTTFPTPPSSIQGARFV